MPAGQGFGGWPNILQLVRTTSLKVLGKPGATAGAGLAGGTTSGAPTTGQFDAGDAVVAQNGHLWICTVAGSPGTWVDAGASGGYTDPLTTRGDLVRRGAASTERLALGASGYVLTSDGTDAAWAAAGAGFADPMSARGDIIVRGGSGTTRLALGSSGQYLKSDGTDAGWAAGAMTQLSDQTVSGSAAATITLSAISGSYNHLLLIHSLRTTSGNNLDNVLLRMNADSGSNYAWQLSTDQASATQYGNSTSDTSAHMARASGGSARAADFSGGTTWLYNYASTTPNKSYTAQSNLLYDSTHQYIEKWVGEWISTAAITSLVLTPGAGSWAIGSRVTLYGLL